MTLNDFMYSLVSIFQIGLSPLAKDIRVFLHNHTLRYDLNFNRIPSDFKGHPKYYQSLLMYGVFVSLMMVFCILMVILFYIKAPSIKPRCRNYLICLKLTVIGLAAVIAILGALALLGFIISNFYLLQIKWNYSNPAANHIYSFDSMLSNVRDIINSSYTTIQGLIGQIANIDIAPLKSSVEKVDKLIPYIQKQLRSFVKIFRNFWVVQYSLIFVEAIVIFAGIAMNVMSILAVVRRAPKLLKFLRMTSLGMLIIWWMLSVMLTPIVLALSDICDDPLTSMSTLTDKYKLVPKGLLPYYLGCKGTNPLEAPFFLLRTGLYGVSLAVRGVVAVLTRLSNMLSMENVKPVLEVLKENMLILDKFTENHLQTSCEWSSNVFGLAADDVCSGVLLGLILTLLASFFMGIVLTFFVVLSMFAVEQVLFEHPFEEKVKQQGEQIEKEQKPGKALYTYKDCCRSDCRSAKTVKTMKISDLTGPVVECKTYLGSLETSIPKNATVAIQTNVPLRQEITRTARAYTLKCDWDIHMLASEKNHSARLYRPKHQS